jgi:hypothetical protein
MSPDEFLTRALEGGRPIPFSQIVSHAHQHGLGISAVLSARKRLGVQVHRSGKISVWVLPLTPLEQSIEAANAIDHPPTSAA